MIKTGKAPPLEEYEGHLNRLIKMKYQYPNTHKHSIDSLKKAHQSHHLHQSLSKRKYRLKTEGNREKRIAGNSMDLKRHRKLELPLIPQAERQLMGKFIESAHLQGRQSQLLLENYLLSRRILHAVPSIKGKQFQKSFRNHEKYANLRSRGRLQAVNASQSRLKSTPAQTPEFNQFQSSLQKVPKIDEAHGSGRFTFTFHIKQLHNIVRHNDSGKLYNLLLKLDKKAMTYPLLSMQSLKSLHSFNFKKKQASKLSCLDLELHEISSNDISKYARFTINLSVPFKEIEELGKYQEYQFQQQNQISSLRSIRNDRIIGTVLYDYSITT